MRVVDFEKTPLIPRAEQHRVGRYEFKPLLWGEDGTASNYFLEVGWNYGDQFSPRHKHNFDQFRHQIRGFYDYDRDGKMTAGMFGYFPEGTYYGPQTSSPDSISLTLQFSGPSAQPYFSDELTQQACAELKKTGKFEKGVYRRNDDVEGKRNVDAYQAMWEYMAKQPMTYPKARYQRPILIDPASFSWATTSEPGVEEKLLGIFTELRARLAILRLNAGAKHQASGDVTIYFVLDGRGKIGDETLEKHGSVSLDRGERATIEAVSDLEVAIFDMPQLGLARKNRKQVA